MKDLWESHRIPVHETVLSRSLSTELIEEEAHTMADSPTDTRKAHHVQDRNEIGQQEYAKFVQGRINTKEVSLRPE
jgi:hypothetical protein